MSQPVIMETGENAMKIIISPAKKMNIDTDTLECRDAADEIVASNDENGVAQGINKILRKSGSGS